MRLLGIVFLLPLVSAAPLVHRDTIHGAVASETAECSEIGTQMLQKGGNAVDSVLASAICVGLMGGHHCGIGGGGFLLLRKPGGEKLFYDFREMAPAASNETMFVGKSPTASTIGGLSVGIPGQLRGFEEIHREHGKLPWADLFAPTIRLAREGFRITGEVATTLAGPSSAFMLNDTRWKSVYAPKGVFLRENETTTFPSLANTLQRIAEEGAEAFYSGDIAKSIVDAVQASGGVLTLEDLRKYTPKRREPLQTTYRGMGVWAGSPPSSGAILLSDLNILEGYKLERNHLTMHRVVEAMKFGFGQRTALGDPDFVANVTEIVHQFLDKDVARKIREHITDNATHGSDWYNPKKFEIASDTGTSQLSAADSIGWAASMTTTINLLWGSRVMTDTGIILNDQMDDFSTPGKSNAFGLVDTPANYIAPGKRPLSSISTALVERDGELLMVTGAAGGSRIITATLQNIINVVDLNMTLAEAVANPRVHDQISPNNTFLEEKFDKGTAEYLASLGHNITFTPPLSAVHAVLRVPTTQENRAGFDAAADPRKVGSGSSVI
ncbi:uncharacterized protein VTP21DRAFT_4189 [Calcarisporiella thermophila]|uniref:uncharacterized protein n=1 Tax=Calcarisporiella thermophila TaxID=911321 RepID=UPI00374423AB